ncbi:hypothetical protein Mapa_012724 [Marchantia paleacea]|nr:hypothetical protein Mapa_012724 [Marchantia paleacea]
MASDQLPYMGPSRDALCKDCEEEIERLVDFFNEEPTLQIVPKYGVYSAGNLIQRKKVAAYMEDSNRPYSVLANEIVEKLGSEGDQASLASIRALVLEIGLRVCFGISNTDADPLEDNNAASLRRWEVREWKLIPPVFREEVSERRRRRRRIMERVASLNSAVELLRAPNQVDDSEVAVLKAREILGRSDDEATLRAARHEWQMKKSSAPSVQQPEVALTASDSTNAAQESSKKRRRSDPEERLRLKQEKLLKKQRIEEEKDQKRREKEEAEKADKELRRKGRDEVEKKKLEKDVEREQRRKEKEEIERKKLEKEAEREHKRKEKEEAERKRQMSLKKQASFMDRFLHASKKEQKEQASQESSDSSAKCPSLVSEAEGKAHTSTVQDPKLNDIVSRMDMIFQNNEDFDLDDLKHQHISSWQKVRRLMSSVRHPGWGTRRKPKASVVRELRLQGANNSPDVSLKKTSAAEGAATSSPTHSSPQKPRSQSEPDALEDVDWKESFPESWPSTPSSEAKKLNSDRYLQLRTKRKKLLQFDKSHRPPYYGTYSRKSDLIKARNPFKQDPMLDYEVDSDEEWEEEEPGESLSDFENEKDDDEERIENDEDEDSSDEFMVPDGYLSEGEGVHMEGGRGDTGGSGASDHCPPAGQCGPENPPNVVSREHLRKILDRATEHALRTNRPLIINNLGWDSEEKPFNVNPPTRTESLILEALRIRVLTSTTIGVS